MSEPTPHSTQNDFNSRLVATLVPHQKTHLFEPGTVLFHQGEQPAGVHVLLSGEVDLLFSGRPDKVPIRFAVSDQILGLSSIVSGRVLEYTTTAASTVLTGFVERDTFFRILHETPDRWFDVLQVLSSDIATSYERVKQLTLRPR